MTTDHLDDEALSAVLDGEATQEEAAHAERCDACSARLDAFRAAAAAIGAPLPAPSEEAREAAIAAALAGAPVSLIDRRAQRTPPVWLLAVAAAVLVLAALGPILARSLDDGGDDEQTAARVEEDAAAGTMSADELLAPSGAAAAPAPGLDLGPVDGRQLADVVRPVLAQAVRQEDAGSASRESAADADAPCEAALRATDPQLGVLRLVADVTDAGRPARLLAFERAPSSIVAIVVAEDCAVLRSETFESP